MTAPSASTTEAQNVLAFLGGRKALGLTPHGSVNYYELVRRGLPYKALHAVTTELAFSRKDVQTCLRLSPRTLQRRVSARLTAVESERILRLARVAAHAVHVLDDRATALRWLTQPNRALEGAVPVSLLDTDVGANDVLEVLDRIQYGVYT